MRTYFRKTSTRNDVQQQVETTWHAEVNRRTQKSAQGQTLLAGDQLDSWPGLVCPGTRKDNPISGNTSTGRRPPDGCATSTRSRLRRRDRKEKNRPPNTSAYQKSYPDCREKAPSLREWSGTRETERPVLGTAPPKWKNKPTRSEATRHRDQLARATNRHREPDRASLS